MSSDDFGLIRKWGGRYYLTTCCASDPGEPSFALADPGVRVFDTLDAAMIESAKDHPEYGTVFVDEAAP